MIHPKSSLGSFAITALVCLAGCQTYAETNSKLGAQADEVDLIIARGTVFDGSGKAGVVGDIAIRGDQIVFVGPDAKAKFQAKHVIDANGLVVAPGFIDPHTHAGSDLASPDAKRRSNLPYVFQGVTTVMVGNDGFGSPKIGSMSQAAERFGIGTNVTYLVGFGAVREEVLGKANRAPNEGELSQMMSLTRTAMCEGAWGFSTGLYYVPQSYSGTNEVIALAQVAGELGGYYDTHMRDESTYNVTVTGALAETLTIGKEAGLPVHIAHIKALGPAVWGHSERMIAMIEKARADGQRVTADQYPWEASGTRISNALVPRWALEGGLDALRGRLSEEETRSKIRAEMIEAITRRGGANRLLVTGRLAGSSAPVGKTLAEIAMLERVAAVDAAIAILIEGDARLASFNMSTQDIAAFAAQDWVVTGSDGSTGHPRKYGSFPKAYRDLVAGEGGMSLARFIRRSSGMTADIIGLDRRGYLSPGHFADVLVFDPESFAPNANYASPRELSSGVVHLYVNGQAVINNGSATGALSGRPLLKDTQC